MDDDSGFLPGYIGRFSRLSSPLQIVVVMVGLLLPAFVVLWIVDKLFLYFLSRSYVDEIAHVFDLNQYTARAISIVVFMVVVYFAGKLGFSKRRRMIGVWGLAGLLITHALFMAQGVRNQFFDRGGKAIKCYVVTREGDVRFRDQLGTDPETGRLCREATPETVERLKEYQKGKRPQRLADVDIEEFHEPRTGEPIVWFWKSKTGEIELFNLMGFHPDTGEELQPVSSAIVEQFKAQRAQRMQLTERRQRPPQRIDPEVYDFFDPATGEPRVWYARDGELNYEFFDNQGFHPRTGQALKPVDAATLETWKAAKIEVRERDMRERARQDREAEERTEREERVRRAQAEREQRERQIQAEREQQERQIQAERQQREAQAATLCDQLAGNPSDPRRAMTVSGVRYEELKGRASQALETCRVAMDKFPDELRYRYQFARALETSDPDKAIPHYRDLIRKNYPAAYDNLASIYIRKRDIRTAIPLLKSGVRANDPDSMVTLADLIERGFVNVQNPVAAKYALLERAAQLGHSGAQLAVERQKAELQQRQQERAFQLQEQQMMLDLFGTLLRGVAR